VQEEHVSNDLDHDRLAGSCGDTIAGTSSEQTLVAGREGLPDVGEDDENAEEDADGTAPEDVADGHDEYVGEAERDDVQAGEQGQLLLVQVELLAKEGEQWGEGER